MQRLILASASPRRQELLRLLAMPFDILPAHLPEKVPCRPPDPVAVARNLATAKARTVAAGFGPETLVLGADTLVVIDGEVLGKPVDAPQALEMLSRLQGRTHEVVTGLALVPGQAESSGGSEKVDAVVTEVIFRPATREELVRYVATGEPFGKAGAYAIQGQGCLFIEGIRGCFFNVVGLPVFRLAQMLAEISVNPFPGGKRNQP